MMQYFDSRGQVIRLGNELGKGGEGSVFELADNPHFVAKIYKHLPIATEKSEKLRLMASIASNDLTKFAALPVATLSASQQGPIVGLLMPRVSGHTEVHNLYSPAHRKLKFPDKDWLFLVHVAMNCAASFDALHQKSIVIGDVNQGNVLVSERGTVFLIDCDSFQLKANGKLFPCEVGVPHFTPPELQKRSNFRDVERTSNHDLFGLAVLVFHLLCMGRHPYAGRFLGSGDMPIEKAITDFRYAYGSTAATVQMAPPPQTLDVRSVMPKVACLFERAFIKSSENPNARPTAQEWYCVLQDFRQSLKACPNDIGHKYPKSLAKCPWCDLERNGAPNFFISVSVKAFTTKQMQLTFDVRTIWSQIESTPPPNQFSSLQLPLVSQIKVVPTALSDEIRQTIGFSHLLWQISIFSLPGCVSYFFSQFLAALCFMLFIVFGVWWLIVEFASGLKGEKQRRHDVLQKEKLSSKQLTREVKSKLDNLSREFQETRKVLGDVKQQIRELKPKYEAEISQLRIDRERSQRDAFLQHVFISDYKIDKIGPGRLSQLSSYGIETAYDIEWNRIRNISGFGDTITANLTSWKSHIESTFRFDHNQPISPSELQPIVTKYAQYNQRHASTLENGLIRLKAIRQDSMNLTGVFQKRISQAIRALAQAEADITVFR